jgi:predicted GIY-YIG superfamily endonuclease
MTQALNAPPTVVYRFYDADDRLLYVGITDEPKQRWRWHARNARWWPDAVRRTLSWHELRSDSAAEEARAIREEHPLHNVAIPGLPPPRRVAAPARAAGPASPELLKLGAEFQANREELRRLVEESEANQASLRAVRAELRQVIIDDPRPVGEVVRLTGYDRDSVRKIRLAAARGGTETS